MIDNIETWAADVITAFTPFAKDLDQAFYPLQSEVKEHPEVLFLGLNPGGGHSYKSQKGNAIWEFNSEETMTVSRLLKGNPAFGDGDTWRLIRGLKSVPFLKEVIDAGDFCLMNYYYLSTHNFKTVSTDPQQEKMLEESKMLTYRFIDIIKPKLIVVLGTANGIDSLGFKSFGTILDGVSKRLLIKGQYQDIPVLAIPHPSMMMLTASEKSALDGNIREIVNGAELTKYNISKIRSVTKLDIDSLIDDLKETHFKFYKADTDVYKCNFPGIGKDDVTIWLVLKPNNSYWGLRASHPLNHDNYSGLQHGQVYSAAIADEKDWHTDAWVVRKQLKNYDAPTEAELQELILRDFTSLSDSIAAHNK